jgi:hypothetical protein
MPLPWSMLCNLPIYPLYDNCLLFRKYLLELNQNSLNLSPILSTRTHRMYNFKQVIDLNQFKLLFF